MRELIRADRVLGRHLFVAESNGPVRRWQRGKRPGTAIAEGITALEPFFRFEELRVTTGTLDEYGQAEEDGAMTLAAGEPWPEATVVDASAIVGAIRVAVPPGARLADATAFVCDAGFLRTAAVTEAPRLGARETVWVEGTSLMETRAYARIDGHALLELRLGTSLHDARDPRDPAWVTEGAALAAWHEANQHVLAAIERALDAAGFVQQR